MINLVVKLAKRILELALEDKTQADPNSPS